MKNLFTSIRTLCLVAVMCMVSANALAYDVYDGHGGNIDVSGSCKILVFEEDATVYNCEVNDGGVLIIKEGKTVTVTTNFHCFNSTIYVYGTLNIEQTHNLYFFQSTVYIMQGGNLVGSYDVGDNTISTNVDPATVSSIGKVDAQVPTPANSFVGWPDYYQQRIYSTDGTDFYPLGDFEDAALTKPIADFDAWKTKYANIYHAAYDAALGSMGEPCDGCPAVEISDDNTTIKLYNPKKVEFMKNQSEE
ncbi:MAG: hypothetical protein MJZ91_10215 [Bacteroidales bacterium]|nr:hypothetical protein [Bacteroidales bacterium]